MKKGLMNNWGLKILSFLLAVMLWLIVVNIDDPVTTQTFNNIPVAVTNAEVLAATNQTYQIEDGTQNVSVTVRAKRSVLNKIKAFFSSHLALSHISARFPIPINTTSLPSIA